MGNSLTLRRFILGLLSALVLWGLVGGWVQSRVPVDVGERTPGGEEIRSPREESSASRVLVRTETWSYQVGDEWVELATARDTTLYNPSFSVFSNQVPVVVSTVTLFPQENVILETYALP